MSRNEIWTIRHIPSGDLWGRPFNAKEGALSYALEFLKIQGSKNGISAFEDYEVLQVYPDVSKGMSVAEELKELCNNGPIKARTGKITINRYPA